MSILLDLKLGYLVSHESLINEIYLKVDNHRNSFKINPFLFDIWTPYKELKDSKKNKSSDGENFFETEVYHVENLYNQLYSEVKAYFSEIGFEVRNRNTNALNLATEIYRKTGINLNTDLYGANPDDAVTKTLNGAMFLFPEKSKFYAKNVQDISLYLSTKYDLVLLDPPWWNKYIRRKRKHSSDAYNMMSNDELKNLPVENYIKDDGLIAVWCTNSNLHLKALKDEIFPKWGVEFWCKWYWVKITKRGEPICCFSTPPRKQPFEQIIFGVKKNRGQNPPPDKLVLSVPSALHSHKPPLSELLRNFLPPHPNCLEIFARYLLPKWTSYGNEVLRFQHESLYK